MLSIGITGGMGSGKTTCCEVFSLLGVPVYNADIRGKYILNENPKARKKIIALFGKDIYSSDGQLDRKQLASIVFNNADLLHALEAIVHPAVQADFETFRKNNLDCPYIIKEAALLFESGTHKALDKIIFVEAPLEIRVKRIQERDNISKEEIFARISKQMPDNQKLALSEFVIHNDEQHLVLPQIIALHKKFLANDINQ